MPFALIESYAPGSTLSSYFFEDLEGQVIASCSSEVKAALEAVEKAVGQGLYAVGYIAYEAASGLNPVLNTQESASQPLLYFSLFKTRQPLVAGTRLPLLGDYQLGEWCPAVSRLEYNTALGIIKEHILDGDSYQVNYTFQQEADFFGDELALYRDLCRSQEAAYSAYLNLGDFQLLSVSPELFFSLQDGILTSRPMKGTRARGRWSDEDQEQADILRASAKEQAENVMIVDLLRNDLGKIAATGSVSVSELWALERYPTVWQLTSTVAARLAADTGLIQIMEALFPCGSVTGAPKAKTMELIRQIEKMPRGVYTGAVGYIAPGLEMRFNVAIRSVWIDRLRGIAQCGIGGGITHYSDTENEYRECLLKARFTHERRPVFELLETLLYEPDKGYFLLERHLQRMAASAQYFGFVCSIDKVRESLNNACTSFGEENQRIRLRLNAAGRCCVEATPIIAQADVFKVILADQAIDSKDVFLYHKTTHRKCYDEQLQHFPQYDEVILFNEKGQLTECCRGNLVIKLEGQWWTPPLDCGLLPGVYRAEEIAHGRLQERVCYKEDLLKAEGLYLINSVRRWVPLYLSAQLA